MRPHGGNGPLEYYMDEDLMQKFCRLFPIHSNRRIMLWFGLSFSTVQRFARQYGLKKNMRAIRKELARDVKKICEANGYYNSLRGQRPSEQCIEATRKMRAEGFHPLRRLKENNPRKYKRLMRQKSEARKELWRKERMRESYGLERKTKLSVKPYTMTRAARSYKHFMIKNYNYFHDPDHTLWVCYDSETSRSDRCETTAARHGLIIVEGEDSLSETGQ